MLSFYKVQNNPTKLEQFNLLRILYIYNMHADCTHMLLFLNGIYSDII